MFDRLEDLLIRYEEVMGELQEPGVADDPVRFRKLMKEQSDLAPIVEAYNEYMHSSCAGNRGLRSTVSSKASDDMSHYIQLIVYLLQTFYLCSMLTVRSRKCLYR